MNPKVHALRDDAVSWTAGDDGSIVALDLRTSRYLSLNTSGSLLWLALADGASDAELSAALVERFGLDQDAARTDVDAFLAMLHDRQLLAD